MTAKKTNKTPALLVSPDNTSAYADGMQAGYNDIHHNCTLLFFHNVLGQNMETARVVLPKDVMEKGIDILCKLIDHYPEKPKVEPIDKE